MTASMLTVKMREHVKTASTLLPVLVSTVSQVSYASSTSTNVRQTLAKMEVHVKTCRPPISVAALLDLMAACVEMT